MSSTFLYLSTQGRKEDFRTELHNLADYTAIRLQILTIYKIQKYEVVETLEKASPVLPQMYI